MSASTDRKFAKFLAFGSAMFGCTWAQVLGIGICLLCLCLCVSVNVRMFVLNSQDNLRLLCEMTRKGSSSIRRSLQFAWPTKGEAMREKQEQRSQHGMPCGISWRRILQVSPQLACALRRSQRGQHNNWLINALQVAAKTKLFSFRGKTLINASLKSRQTTRCKQLRAAAGAELFITSTQANTEEKAEVAGEGTEGELGQLEESQQTACSQSETKTYAITRGGAEPRPGSEDTGMDTGMGMDMVQGDMAKVDMEQLDIEAAKARLSKGAAQQCQRQRRRRRQKSQRGQAVKNEL